MIKLIAWLNECHKILSHPAHKAERPLHVVYFVLVFCYASGPYGAAAGLCALITLLSWGDDDTPRSL